MISIFKHMNLPNILSLFRVVLVPVFLVFYFSGVSNFWCAFVVWLAAVTDYFDGYLARALQLQTSFGAFIDPVADKLIVCSVLVVLAYDYQSAWITIPAVIIISREITISALREWMAEKGKRAVVKVSSLGKYKTTSQMLALIGLVWKPEGYLAFLHVIAYALYFIACILTVWSMVEYLYAAFKEMSSPDA